MATVEFETLARYQAAEFRGAMLRLSMAAMLGSQTATRALAEASADASI